MTTITLEIPDELAAAITPMQEHLPALLHELLTSSSGRNAAALPRTGVTHPAWQEMIDFLASGPTPRQIIACRPSAAVARRLQELLEKNRNGILTRDESTELDLYEQIENLMGLLKARAQQSCS
jgi:hypothetical protein